LRVIFFLSLIFRQTSRSSSRLALSILEGKGTFMPPWNAKVTPEQARDLVFYVRSFGGPAMLSAETGGEAPGALSFAEFGNRMRSLQQRFSEIENQWQTLRAHNSR
jgi:hypothetical protein